MIATVTRKLDVNATVGPKRPAEVILDQLLVQAKGRLYRPSIAAREGKKGKLRRAWESALMEFVRFVHSPSGMGNRSGLWREFGRHQGTPQNLERVWKTKRAVAVRVWHRRWLWWSGTARSLSRCLELIPGSRLRTTSMQVTDASYCDISRVSWSYMLDQIQFQEHATREVVFGPDMQGWSGRSPMTPLDMLAFGP
jgi:hypothetical protein